MEKEKGLKTGQKIAERELSKKGWKKKNSQSKMAMFFKGKKILLYDCEKGTIERFF